MSQGEESFPNSVYEIYLERRTEGGWKLIKTLGDFDSRGAAIACVDGMISFYSRKGCGDIRALIVRTVSVVCTEVYRDRVEHKVAIPGEDL